MKHLFFTFCKSYFVVGILLLALCSCTPSQTSMTEEQTSSSEAYSSLESSSISESSSEPESSFIQESSSEPESSCIKESSSELESSSIQENFSESESSSIEESFSESEASSTQETSSEVEPSTEAPTTLIVPSGMTLDSRFLAPTGYEKVSAPQGSLLFFMRNMELKPDGSPILLYDGTIEIEDHHAAVFAMDVGTVNLQQCADSIIRVYAEYLWSIGAYDKIGFHLTSGFWMDYANWRNGNRISVNGSDVQWVPTTSYDDSYETFRKYLTQVFVYAGTLSLDEHSQPISVAEAVPGDMILKGGSPGHAILLVDMAVNSEGKKCFLIAEGHLPAEDFHVMKNPLHPNDPWYYEEEIVFPFDSPRFVFPEGSLQRYFEAF